MTVKDFLDVCDNNITINIRNDDTHQTYTAYAGTYKNITHIHQKEITKIYISQPNPSNDECSINIHIMQNINDSDTDANKYILLKINGDTVKRIGYKSFNDAFNCMTTEFEKLKSNNHIDKLHSYIDTDSAVLYHKNKDTIVWKIILK